MPTDTSTYQGAMAGVTKGRGEAGRGTRVGVNRAVMPSCWSFDANY